MTRGEVLFNYNQAMAQARRLDALAKQVELLSRNKIEDKSIVKDEQLLLEKEEIKKKVGIEY